MNTGINDKLDALIALTAKDCGNDDVEMFDKLDTSKVTFDKLFYMKLRHIISKHKHSATVLSLKKCLVRVAVALMALMSLGFLAIMAAPDLREALFEAVVEWYEDYISIRYEPVENNTHETNKTNDNTEAPLTGEALDESTVPCVIAPPTMIEKVMKPAYLPDGVEEETVGINTSFAIFDYFLGDEIIYTFNQTLLYGNDKLFDEDNAVISKITVNDHPATLIEYNDRKDKFIAWTDGIYFYHIGTYESFIGIDELIKIAESVQ